MSFYIARPALQEVRVFCELHVQWYSYSGPGEVERVRAGAPAGRRAAGVGKVVVQAIASAAFASSHKPLSAITADYRISGKADRHRLLKTTTPILPLSYGL